MTNSTNNKILDKSAKINILTMRIISTALTICLVLISLCSCRGMAQYREPEQQYLVAAMGFDRSADFISVSLEVIIFSVGDAQGNIETRVFTGEGISVKQAIASLSGEIAKKLLYSHCSLIILGESLTPEQTGEVLDFCIPSNDINISASVICAPNANELIGCGSISTPVTGYDMAGVLKQKSRDWGITLKNHIHEIKSARLRGDGFYSLPFFVVTMDEDKKIYSFFGTRIYIDDMPALIFDLPESALYSLLCGGFEGGSFFINVQNVIYEPMIRRADTSVSANRETGELRAGIEIKLKLDRSRSGDIDISILTAALAAKSESFFNKTQTGHNADLFNLSGRLKNFSTDGMDFNISELSGITISYTVDFN